MAIRYIAAVFEDPSRIHHLHTRLGAAHDLVPHYNSAHCAVWTNAPVPIFRAGRQAGAMLGTLFSRSEPTRALKMIDAAAGDRILKTSGAHLVADYWGGYVALLSHEESGHIHIIRDPSGAMPCYYIALPGIVLIASDVELIVATGLVSPKVDYSALARHLFAADLRTPRTALAGIHELLAGQRLTLPGGRVTPVWSPWETAMAVDDRPAPQLARDLRRTLADCVTGWASSYQHVLLSLSGGLDSSVLACALGQTGIETTCVTLSTADPDGDERAYARLAAGAQGLRLLEEAHHVADIQLDLPTSPHLPRPSQFQFAQSANRMKWAAAERLGIDAYFSGVGGDNVFCHLRSSSPLIDRFRARGRLPELWETLTDICRMTGCSYGEAIRMALKRQLKASPRYDWKGLPGFLSKGAVEDIGDTLYHPWLEAPSNALPGKAAHVAMLVRIQGTIDGFPRTLPPDITPLLSQPLTELCLSIPTWRWCEGGRDRSVARLAFESDLPETLIRRKSKGTPNVFAFEIVERHRQRLRERLHDGFLAREGLIDIQAVDRVLDPEHVIQAPDHILLLGLSEAEAWVAHWETTGAKPAATHSGSGKTKEALPDARAGPP